MICQWQELLNILPGWMKVPVDKAGREEMQELRLRLHSPPEIIKQKEVVYLNQCVSSSDLSLCLNAATRYSPWTSSSISEGFVTIAGGHRIGICGDCVYDGNKLKNITSITSLCIRVARDFTGISKDLYQCDGSILIIGRPGSGKTTFLRDLIRSISNHKSSAITVVDERRELFPVVAGKCFLERGCHTDVISGCKKSTGLEMAIRTMGPDTVALDEITSTEDCTALIEAAWCGVRLIATAHAGNRNELYSRVVYQELIKNQIFQNLIILHPDKSWHKEAM